MSTKVLNVLENRGSKKYKFLKKKDRLNLVNIGEYRPWTEPVRQEKLKKPNFTFFREALDYWSELDVSADFVSFRQKTNLYGHSLSLLLAKRRRTVKLLLNRLRKRPRTIAFQSLCGCLLAFVRDIRHRFVEYIPVTWKVLSEFMDFESEEIMSCIFSTLNSLGKILWEPMLKQFPKTWNLWKPFIVHKTSQVRVLAAQCFGFVLRKGIVEDMLPNMITQIFQEVTVPSLESIKCREMLQRTVDGVCESFIQILVSPIGKQLLSKSDLVLKTLLQQAFMDNECFACSGFFVLQQLFVKILKQIPYSGTQWLFVHLLDFLKYDLLSNEVVIVNNIENKSSCRFPYFLSICLMGFCCLNDFSHVITIDNIWNAFQSILQMTDIITESYVMDAFSYSCLFYSLENLLLLLANEDASQLNILWSQLMEQYIRNAYFPLFLKRMIVSISYHSKLINIFCHNSLYLYWERFKVCPENELYWQVLLALCKQHVEIDVGIDVIQQLFTSALSYLSNHTSEMSLFRSLLDICCEIRNDRMLREWESFLEKYYLKNGQVDSSSKWLMSRVCSKMLISGCSLSSWFHEWIQELVFLEDEVEMQVLRASLISLQTHGVLCKKTRVSFNLKEIAPNHLLKCLLFASIKKRQVVLELLSTIGKWVEWKDCSVFELIFAVENVPKIPTYVSESLLKTQRVIDYLQYQRKGLTSIADSSPVMYVLCFETLTWLRCELSPVQPNIYEIWKHLCRLCPNAVLFAVKQVLSMDLSQITKEPRTLEEHISSVMCTEHSQIQNAIFQWIQLNQKHFKSFIFYYEALKSLLENGQNSNDSKVMEFSDIIESECKEKDWLDERMNFNSWHIQLLKAIEATLPDSEIIALHLLKSFFMIVVGRNAAKNAFAEWSFKLMERYLSLFLCCHKEQHRLTTFAEWVKDNYQAIEDRLLSVIVSGKGNTQQLALSCQVRCMQPFLSSYETWLIRLQSSKHFKDVYTHFFAALFQNVSIQMLGTSESSLSIQTSHLVEIKKLVLQILLGKLNDITEKAKLETNVLTLLSGFREPDDVNLLWRLLWQPLLDCMGLDQVEEVLERIDDIPWNDKLRFSICLEKIQKAIPLSLFALNMRETLQRWCIGCLYRTQDGNVFMESNKGIRHQLRSVSLYLLSSIIDSSLPLSEFMISNIFDWLRNMRSTLEAYRPNDGQTPAMLIALDKITSCEPLTFRIMENQHLCECCIELMLKFIRYYRQNEDTLFYCVSIWKHLFSVAQDNNICLSCLEGKSKREEIWLSLTNNIFRIWDTIKRPGKSHSRKLQSLDALLEMMLQFDYHQSVTTGIDKQLQSPFEKLLKHIVSTLGNIHYWKHASHVAEKSKDLMALYIQRMDGQKWLSHLICSKLAYILFELNTVILEDHCVIEKVDQMLLELCKCLAEKLSESWLNVVSEHLPDMLCIVNENGKDCIEIERRVNALEVVVSNLESLLDLTTEHSVEGLFVSNERDCPPSYIPLLLLSYACFRNIVLEDLSLCILAGRGLKAVGRFLISQLAKNVSDSSMQYDIVLQQLVESCNVLLFSHSSFGIQRVLFMTIGTWVYTWYSICSDSSRRTIQIPCLECFFPMISSSLSNIEESWFANMVHLQLHRRCRACLEISRKVDVCQPFANILMKFAISWTFQRCLESINATRNGTMERWYQVMSILVDTSVQKMAWQDYKHFLERILKKWIHMKNCMHPTSKKEWNLWIKLGEIFISSLPKWIELENKNRKELYLGRDTNDDGDIHESQQSGVVYDPYQNYMEERLIPLIARVLKELSYSSISIEEKKYSRITPQFADLLIRALHSLDDSQREKYVNEIIRYLTSQIRSKSQRQRELARNCFCTMLKHWGVSYMRRIYDATKATCQDGFRVYVLRYSIFYYVKCLAENNMIIQDADLVREWMNIFQEEISSLVDDQENRIPYQECKEVSSFYIHDALTLLAKIAQGKESWDLWKYFLTSCCRLNGVKNPSRKKQLVRNFFPHLVKSLLSCPDLNQALWFVYALMKEKQPLTGKDGQKEEKLSLEESSILLLEFALQLLYRLLKRLNSQVNPTQYEDVLKTFFPMVNQLFRTKNEFLCSYSLRVIQLLWKVTALPRTPKHWNDIFQYASSLLSNVSRLDGTGSSSNGALVHAAIRTLSTIITKLPANGHKNKSWQEEYIIPLIRIMQQIFSSVSVDWMPSLLHLIRVFVKHRLGFRAPEMFSLMNTLSQMAIQSSEKAVREAIVSIWIDFILHYPIPESVFHEYVQYFVSNLQYPYSFGRQASANILSKWLLESSTSPIWKEKEISLFVATSAQKANEEDLQVRQTFSNLLITLFSCMDEQRRVYVLEMIEEWSSNEKKELQLFAIVVVECLCDISNLRKSELALLLKISGKCLQSMSLQFSSLEATDVHFAFGALLSCLERILKHRPDWIVRESFLDIYKCMWKYELFATNTLSVRRKLDSLIASLSLSLETLNGVLERKAEHLLLLNAEDTFLATLLNCCIDHLSVDPLADDTAKLLSENINRLLNWMEKFRSNDIRKSTVEHISLDCLMKLSKIASGPNLPSDTFGTFRRQIALELVRDRLKVAHSIWSTNVSTEESYARPLIRLMLRCWRDFGEPQRQQLNRKRKKKSLKTSLDETETIQLVLQDIECLLSSRMSSSYHTLLNNMREEYIQRRKARKLKK